MRKAFRFSWHKSLDPTLRSRRFYRFGELRYNTARNPFRPIKTSDCDNSFEKRK